MREYFFVAIALAINDPMKKTSVIIIGAGPAGITAALQLKRFGIPFLLFESKKFGGLLHNANLVENYPGFPRGVRGAKLVSLFKKQIEHIGVEIFSEKVISLEYREGYFFAKTTSPRNKGFIPYRAEIAIIASGTKARQFDDAIIAKGAKGRVFYEVSNLMDVRNKNIIIVGAGDAAFDYALNLAQENDISILNRGRKIKALGLLEERVSKNRRISYEENVQVEKISVKDECLTVDVLHKKNAEKRHASLILGALGRIPNFDFLGESIQSQEKELTDGRILHFIGDVRNGIFRQTAIAAGEGLRAAMEIEKKLKEKE